MEQAINKRITDEAVSLPLPAHDYLCRWCGRPGRKTRKNQIFCHDSQGAFGRCRMEYWADYYSRLRDNARSIEARNAKLHGQRYIFDRPMDTKDHLILGHLEAHKGRENAIPARELAALVQMSMRDLRRRIKPLIEYHGALIGSSTHEPSGYYLITDPAELAMAVGQLISWAGSILKRVAKIKKVAVEEIYGQLRIEL